MRKVIQLIEEKLSPWTRTSYLQLLLKHRELCGIGFANKTYLTKQLKTVNGYKKYFCKLFKGLLNYRKGVEHSSKRNAEAIDFNCDLCGKRLRCISYLKNHLEHVYKLPKNFKCYCQFCGKEFEQQRSLRLHVPSPCLYVKRKNFSLAIYATKTTAINNLRKT